MAQDTVNGHPLPTNGNIASGGNKDIAAVITAVRIFATAIDENGNVDSPGISGAVALTAADANALAVGANGATNPVFNVDSATSSVATGIGITGAAAAGGVAMDVLSSGTNESMTIDAKGTGTVTINGTGTGNVVIGSGLHTPTGVDVTTAANVGTANTGVTAVEHGDSKRHTTVLTVSQVDALTTGDNAALADGYLLYTFPAGAIIIHSAYMSMGITATAEQQADTPDVGLGTVIGTGSVATLDGTATFEDILTGQTAADANNTPTVKTVAAQPVVIEAAEAHTVHFNAADTWADDTSGDLTADIAGTVVIEWSLMN